MQARQMLSHLARRVLDFNVRLDSFRLRNLDLAGDSQMPANLDYAKRPGNHRRSEVQGVGHGQETRVAWRAQDKHYPRIGLQGHPPIHGKEHRSRAGIGGLSAVRACRAEGSHSEHRS